MLLEKRYEQKSAQKKPFYSSSFLMNPFTLMYSTQVVDLWSV